jgi:hypothetical protein
MGLFGFEYGTQPHGLSAKRDDRDIASLLVAVARTNKSFEDCAGSKPANVMGGIFERSATIVRLSEPSVLIGRKGTIDQPQYWGTPLSGQ